MVQGVLSISVRLVLFDSGLAATYSSEPSPSRFLMSSRTALSTSAKYMCSGTVILSGVIVIIYASLCRSSCSDFFHSFSVLHVDTFSMSGADLSRFAAVHQNIGNCRWMLLNIRDVARVMTELKSTSGRRNHPRREIVGSVAARSAVAPAGGWTVLVNPITAEAKPQANAPASHLISSNRWLSPKSLVTPIPITAAMKCPTIEFRGCDRGDSIVLYSSIAAAPYVALAFRTFH